MNLKNVSRLTEDQARETLERIRWPNGVVCPHCNGADRITKLEGKNYRPGLYKCYACRKQFTVTVNSIFERSHIPLKIWLMAFALICGAKKGISALQLQRHLGLGSYQAAWHMAHRIRHAMTQEPLASLLGGVVEVDETYVGGKPRKGSGQKAKSGRGTKKAPVVALVERGGRVRAQYMERLSGPNLRGAVLGQVDRNATLMTDQWSAYKGIGKAFADHQVVHHSIGEYARGDAHINTAESFFALLKRGVMGSFHHISRTHMDRYLTEFSFRWDHRKIDDASRTMIALQQSEGKRLTYKRPIKK